MLLLRLLFVLEHPGLCFRCTDHQKWKVKVFLFWIRHLQLPYVMLFHVISVIHVLISTFGISQMVRRTKKRTYLFQLSKKAPSIAVVYWLGGCGLPPRLVPTLRVTGWYQRRMGYWYYSWFIWPKIWSAKITKNKHKLRFCNSFNCCIFGSGTKRSKHHKCHKWLKLISPILPSTQKNIEKCWREISRN